MAKFFVLFAAIACATGASLNKQGTGWGQPSTTVAPTTTSSSTTASPGWGSGSNSGWGQPSGLSNAAVNLGSNISAVGTGTATEQHGGYLQPALGGDGVPVQITIVGAGDVNLQASSLEVQATGIDGTSANGVNTATFGQDILANESVTFIGSGLELNIAPSGSAAVTGSGASTIDAVTSVVANQNY